MWYLIGLYFVLSFLMAWVIIRLPVYCQSWAITSVWGIASVMVGYTLVYPEMTEHTVRIALIFLAAFPGMLLLEFWQRWERIWYWEKVGAPKEWQNRPVWLVDLVNGWVDSWVEWWIDRRIEKIRKEAVREAEAMIEKRCE